MTETERNGIRIGYLCATLCAVLYGFMPLFTKIAYANGSDVLNVSFFRFFFCALFSLPIAWYRKEMSPFFLNRRETRWMLLLAACYSTLPLTLYGSYRFINASLASALHFTYPVFVMILSVLVLRTPVEKTQIVCILLCMGGIVLLTQFDGRAGLWGIVLAMLSGLFYAFYVIALAKSGLKEMPMMKMVFWLSVFTSAVLFLIAVAMRNPIGTGLPLKATAAHMGLAFFSTVFPLALFQRGLALVGAVKSTLLSTFEPITGVLIGVFVFHDVLTLRIAAGIVLILASVVLLVKE